MNDLTGWLAKELSSRPGTTVADNTASAVFGAVPTLNGPAEYVFEQFSTEDASVRLHVMPEPAGTWQNLGQFHRQLDQTRSELFDRRIDVIDSELWYGRDVNLPTNPQLAQQLVGKTLADLSSELPTIQVQLLKSAMTNRLNAAG
jgi:hypothetical protein